MKRSFLLTSLLLGAFVVLVGCGTNPLVEGAKVHLNNQNYDQALENLNQAIAEDPTNAEAWRYKGIVLQEKIASEPGMADDDRAQMVRDMAEAYSQALELDPERAPNVQLRMQQAWGTEQRAGIEAFNEGTAEGYRRAAARFGNATIIAPDSASSYVNMGRAYYLAEDYEASATPFERAIELGDPDPDNYLLLSQVYLTLNRPDDAIRVLLTARERNPDDMNVLAQLLNAYLITDQLDQGLATAQELVADSPDDFAAQYTYGTLLLQVERFDEAIEHLTRAVEIDGQQSDALYNLGAAYNNKAKQLTDRINQVAEQETPDEAELERLRAERLSLFQDGIPYLERARELKAAAGESVADICRSLGQAYTFTNQLDKAEEAYACADADTN